MRRRILAALTIAGLAGAGSLAPAPEAQAACIGEGTPLGAHCIDADTEVLGQAVDCARKVADGFRRYCK